MSNSLEQRIAYIIKKEKDGDQPSFSAVFLILLVLRLLFPEAFQLPA